MGAMDDVQRIAEALAARLGRPVAIDDPQMNLMAHTAHDDGVDKHRVVSVMRLRAPEEVVTHALAQGIASATGPVKVPAIPEIELFARVCIPVRCQGLLLAFLWLIDDDSSLTDDDLALATESAGAVGEVLFRERLLGDLRESRERELVRDLLADDLAVRSTALEPARRGGDAPAPLLPRGPVDQRRRHRAGRRTDRLGRRAAPLRSARAAPGRSRAVAWRRSRGAAARRAAGTDHPAARDRRAGHHQRAAEVAEPQ